MQESSADRSAHLRSLGRRTDLMFARFAGEIRERDDYVVIHTPSNLTYHWGNYLIFRAPPAPGDYKRWSALFEQELRLPNYSPAHRLFAWDISDDDAVGAAAEFTAQGMRLDEALVLTTREVAAPPHPNSEIDVRPIRSDDQWRAVIEQQIESRLPEFSLEPYRRFKEEQFVNYRRMSEAGHGSWFGAFLGDQIVGDLGLFHDQGIARYQAVTTRESFRRQGICGTLVHRAAALLASETAIDTFVMEADPEYHAARIYESVGFRRTEVNHAVYSYPEMRSPGQQEDTG